MPGGFLLGLKKGVLWEYPRASWQYDVLVGLILAFLFLTPREWFNDQPRIARASDIVTLPAQNGSNVFFLDAELLREVPEADRLRTVAALLKTRTGKLQNVSRLEPIFDSDSQLKGFMAFAKP